MIASVTEFLRYFDAVHRRAMRDIAALPPEADGWAPAVGEGEGAWSINVLIGHMAGARLYFASAYRGEGWVQPQPPDTSMRENWLSALDDSARKFTAALKDTPGEWLSRKVAMIDSDGALSGWRVLMMMVEHDIHHRSQIDTYAGINAWPVPDIYNRSAETIGSLQQGQREKHASQ
jgi:uncharacterized damage-inducible protein DinB